MGWGRQVEAGWGKVGKKGYGKWVVVGWQGVGEVPGWWVVVGVAGRGREGGGSRWCGERVRRMLLRMPVQVCKGMLGGKVHAFSQHASHVLEMRDG